MPENIHDVYMHATPSPLSPWIIAYYPLYTDTDHIYWIDNKYISFAKGITFTANNVPDLVC